MQGTHHLPVRGRRWRSRRSWLQKFSAAGRGLWWALRSQSSFTIHFLAAATVIACAAVWRVTALEWCLLVGAIGIVCVAELFNTAIESLARAIAIGHHPRIRDALDVASGAVLLSAIVAALIGGIVFVPRASAWLGLR